MYEKDKYELEKQLLKEVQTNKKLSKRIASAIALQSLMNNQ